MDKFSPYIERIELVTAGGGRFEVTVDGALIYSKLATDRHAAPGEVAKLFMDKTGFNPVDRG